MYKQFISILLAMFLTFELIPAGAIAAEADVPAASQASEETADETSPDPGETADDSSLDPGETTDETKPDTEGTESSENDSVKDEDDDNESTEERNGNIDDHDNEEEQADKDDTSGIGETDSDHSDSNIEEDDEPAGELTPQDMPESETAEEVKDSGEEEKRTGEDASEQESEDSQDSSASEPKTAEVTKDTTTTKKGAASSKAGSGSGAVDMSDMDVSYADVSKTWGGDMMGMTAALEKAPATDNTVTVAVVDTGINVSHEWFSGRIQGSNTYVGNGCNDDNGHGSHVAGIIAQNTPGNVQILAIKALNSSMQGTPDNICDAIRYAADQGADIINLSLGFSKNSIEDDSIYTDYVALLSSAISYANNKGCLIVTSAGNEGADIDEVGSYPAGSANVITVSAISDNESLYGHSNYGGALDFCAPGEDIYSAWKGSPSYQQLSGTSMAAPFISAALAWIMLYNPDKDPVNILRDCCESIGDFGSFGSGLPVFENGIVPGAEQEITDRPIIKKFSCDGKSIRLGWDNPEGCTFSVYRKGPKDNDYVYLGGSREEDYSDSDKNFIERETYSYRIVAETEGYYKNNESETIDQEFYIPVTKTTIFVDGEEYSSPLNMIVGESKKLSLKIEPENATYRQIKWESRYTNLVSVDENGIATAINTGTAAVYALIGNRKTSDVVQLEISPGGKCGDNLYWSILEDGSTLMISGEGAMYDFDDINTRRAPWYDFREEITRIVVDDGVTVLGSYSFAFLKNAESIEGLRDVEEIRDYAFNNCTFSLALPKNVKLCNKALHYAELEKLIIPSNVIYTFFRDTYCFSKIKEYIVSEDNTLLSSEDGILFNKEKTELISYPHDRTGLYIVPDTVTKIGGYAFYDRSIEKIIIPASVTEIDSSAFFSCKNLKEVNMSENVESFAADVFGYCESLEKINFPDGLKSIGYRSFGNTPLERIVIPENVTKIDQGAFYRCSKLSNVIIKGNIKEIGTGVFSYCRSLEEITLPGTLQKLNINNHYTYLGATFSDCDNLKKVFFGGFIKQFDNLEDLDKNEHLRNAELLIDINGTCGDLTWRVTGNRNDLLTLTISGTGEMPDFSHPDSVPWKDGLDEIKHVVIEDGVTHVGSYAFYLMENLEDVKLSSSVTTYGRSVFRGDPKLEIFHHDNGASEEQLHISVQYLMALYSGETYEPAVIVEKGPAENNESWVQLIEGKDFTVEYKNTRDFWKEGTIVVHFIGEYADAKDVTIPFIVVLELLKGENIKVIDKLSLSDTEKIYNGKLQGPNVVVKSGRWTLTLNADYTLSAAKFRDAGTYSIVATGAGAYTGTLSKEFEITRKDIDSVNVSLSPSQPYTYNGKAWEPVRIAGLTRGKDYTITYSNNIGPGIATAQIKGRGNYTGEREEEFTINARRNLGQCAQISLSSDSFVYSGDTQKPSVVIKDGSKTLREGTDYMLAWSSGSKTVGSYTVTAEGLGNYDGSISAHYIITPKSLGDYTQSVSLSATTYRYDGSAKEPRVIIPGLTAGTDYTVSYSDNVWEGTATAVATGKGNYTGEIRKTFTITSVEEKILTEITLSNRTYTYDSKAHRPAVTVKSDGKNLQEGRDYTLTGAGARVEAGTYTVTAAGAGEYKGSVSESFTIERRSLDGMGVTLSKSRYTYDGKPKKPLLIINGLISGADYTLSYSDNTSPGTATVTATGIGNYQGTITRTFLIVESDRSDTGKTAKEAAARGTTSGETTVEETAEAEKTKTAQSTGEKKTEDAVGLFGKSESSDTDADNPDNIGTGDATGSGTLQAAQQNGGTLLPIFAAAISLAAAGVLFWIFLLWKRRKDEDEEEG